MLDLDKTCVIIPAYPNGMVSCELALWTRMFKHVRITKIPDIVVAYNLMLEDAASNREGFDNWLYIDNDMRPGADAEEFLKADADIVGCRYATESQSAWNKPTAFHSGFFRIKSAALGKLSLPYFDFKYNANKTRRLGCMCTHLQDKAIESGLTIAVAGWSEHDNKRSWC